MEKRFFMRTTCDFPITREVLAYTIMELIKSGEKITLKNVKDRYQLNFYNEGQSHYDQFRNNFESTDFEFERLLKEANKWVDKLYSKFSHTEKREIE